MKDDPIVGTVKITPKKGKKLEHKGIKIELIGQIVMFHDRGNHYDFLTLQSELEPPGELSETKTYNFAFETAEKVQESYNGINVRLRYLLRVTATRGLGKITEELDFWVYNHSEPPKKNNTIKMEVGIEDSLHIEFEYNKSKYHLKDVIIGKIFFLVVRIKIKHMELSLIKRELTGTPPNSSSEDETLTKYEVMDGSPVRGEAIPVRLFLAALDLTPTYKSVHNKFSVKYFLNLVLVDESDRRYFKQQEIYLFRRVKTKKAPPANNQQDSASHQENKSAE